MDRFDGILADAGQTVENMSWMLVCDRPEKEQLKMLLLAVLNFTALLIEYSFSRHLYSSIEVREYKAMWSVFNLIVYAQTREFLFLMVVCFPFHYGFLKIVSSSKWWGFSSVVVYLPNGYRPLGLILRTTRGKR